jgi:hypothetical protein
MLSKSWRVQGDGRRQSMKRIAVAGALMLAVLVPAGWATAITLPGQTGAKTPTTHPKVTVGPTHKKVHAGGTTVGARTRGDHAGANGTKLKSGKVRGPLARGGVKARNSKAGGLALGVKQRPSGHNGASARGSVGGTPVRTGVGL